MPWARGPAAVGAHCYSSQSSRAYIVSKSTLFALSNPALSNPHVGSFVARYTLNFAVKTSGRVVREYLKYVVSSRPGIESVAIAVLSFLPKPRWRVASFRFFTPFLLFSSWPCYPVHHLGKLPHDICFVDVCAYVCMYVCCSKRVRMDGHCSVKSSRLCCAVLKAENCCGSSVWRRELSCIQ